MRLTGLSDVVYLTIAVKNGTRHDTGHSTNSKQFADLTADDDEWKEDIYPPIRIFLTRRKDTLRLDIVCRRELVKRVLHNSSRTFLILKSALNAFNLPHLIASSARMLSGGMKRPCCMGPGRSNTYGVLV